MDSDYWVFFAVCVVAVIGAAAGWASAYLAFWSLRRSHYSLQMDVAALEDRLLREVKTRAAHTAQKSKKEDEEFAAKLVAANGPAKNGQPWWMQHVHPDLK